MNTEKLAIFAMESSRMIGERIAEATGVALSEHEERDFPDGEHKCRPLADMRNRDVFVIQSLYADQRQSVNDKLCRLLFFVGALRDAFVRRVTVVFPYLCYARADQKVEPGDPVIIRYVAALLEAVGVDRVVALDVHNVAAFENAFRIPTEHLQGAPLFVRHFASVVARRDLVVVAPDAGGIKRAERFREALSKSLDRPVASAFMTKQRTAGGLGKGRAKLSGDVRGQTAIILDDMISTGATIKRVVDACRENGAEAVYAAATHGLFAGEAISIVADVNLRQVVVADSVPPFRLDPQLAAEKLVALETAPLFAQAIRGLHQMDSPA
jgi:ribose-phosphate pyrophosphokinase